MVLKPGVTRNKTVEQTLAGAAEPGRQLRRTLTSWDLVVFGVAVVIGAGIFAVGASTAGDYAGPSVTLSFLLAAVACGFAALCYAEFASTVPVAGSAYTFAYATFGELFAWIVGWNLLLELAFAAGVVAQGWSSYLAEAFDLPGTSVHIDVGGHGTDWFGIVHSVDFDWGAFIIVAGVTAALALGVKLSARVSGVITVIKVSVVLFVIIAGAFYIKASNYTPFIPQPQQKTGSGSGLEGSLFAFLTCGAQTQYGWYGLFAGASIVFFAFVGFDVVATTAEEVKNPAKDLPRGIIGSLAICTVLYLAVSLVATGMVPYTQLRTTMDAAGHEHKANLATAFSLHGVDWAAKLISFGALAGLTTVVLVLLLGTIRLAFAMSRDGLLPRRWSVTTGNGNPMRLTLGAGVLAGVIACVFPIGKLEEMVNVGTLFAFVLVAAGVIVLRRTQPDLERGFRTPAMPWVPLAAIASCAWLMLNLSLLTWVRFGVWLLVGLLIYAAYGYRHSVLGRTGGLVEKVPAPETSAKS
ncbi:amino acid permease-associated region [Segniliparus rotundus DSM 44985]|uniref:Amino acid permease-associated region n=1 Tax=Segniliparus rotundus (strain ATCC BAA-972 / CDC 1076 / CIP 108378 / DSM 44985 / JCM 13578) TaxID=640132 RepID=D6ZA02_SEGRD|nr:amino acid permease [Segniliparus rotundus]ADG98672.1 amino acid permease-associated region [Segniliparus rotundus DSM 44985]